MRKTVLAILLVLGVVAAAVTYRALAHASPYTRTALGATVTLKSMQRQSDDRVEAVLIIKMPKGTHRVVAGDTSLTGDKAEMDGSSDDKTPAGRLVTHTVYFRIAQGAKSVSMDQEVHWDLPCQHATFAFKNVDPRHLPVKCRFRNAEMILKQVMVNEPVNPKQWLGADRFASGGYYSLVIERRWPTGCVGTNMCTLTDDRGRKPYLLDQCQQGCDPMSRWNAAVRRALIKSGPQTLTEKMVGKVSPTLANKIGQKRFDEVMSKEAAALRFPDVQIWIFPAMNPRPRSFTFATTAELPPRKEDSRTVTFEDVPIPFPAKHSSKWSSTRRPAQIP